MKRVLLFQDQITEYRINIFNRIAEQVNLTVVYAEGELPKGCKFNNVKVNTHRFRGYTFLGKEFRNIAKSNDVVILPLSQGLINTRIHLKNKKYVFWGIGVPASYNCRYDSLGDNDIITKMVKKANCCLFYSKYPIDKYKRLGIDVGKMFVANNTVDIPKIELTDGKNTIIFVGTLYPQKKIEVLLDAYDQAYQKNSSIPDLIIIGDGVLRTKIEEYCCNKGLINRVHLLGKLFDESVLKKHFGNALACISPDQAGLSVLKSMGYGVPYITYKHAITGGEIFNIENGVNGVLFDNYCELVDIILEIGNNSQRYIEMGKKAYEYYWNTRKPEIMVDGFIQAVEYVTKH